MKSPNLKYIPYWHGLELNQNLFPPVNFLPMTSTLWKNTSLAVKRDSAAFVWNNEGVLEFLPKGSGNRQAGRLDWSPREQCTNTYEVGGTAAFPFKALAYAKPEVPDILIEPQSTNYASDLLSQYTQVGSNISISTNSNNTATIAFDGLIDPQGRQYAQAIYASSSTTGYWEDGVIGQTQMPKGWSHSLFVKTNKNYTYDASSSTTQQLGAPAVFIRCIDKVGL